MKAIGTSWTDEVDWLLIEVRNHESGKPYIELSGRAKDLAENSGVTQMHVSMSHTPLLVSAFVILEGAVNGAVVRGVKWFLDLASARVRSVIARKRARAYVSVLNAVIWPVIIGGPLSNCGGTEGHREGGVRGDFAATRLGSILNISKGLQTVC